MLCGQAGSGKTHVTTALAMNFLKRSIKVVYMPYREFITKLKMNMDDFEFYAKTTFRFKTSDVLFIDDLFKGKINESDINIKCDIINPRYENNLPIIVSTEFSVEGLLSFDGSIGSKIYDMCKDYIVEIEKVRENNYRLS